MSANAALSAGEEEAPVIRFAGEVYEPLPSGALFWRAEGTLLVADLHLEKMSSFARSGQLLPPYDTGMTLLRLEADLRLTGAERVIALGDSFHRDEGTATLMDRDRARLERLTQLAEWTWLSGNHDPAPHTLGGVCRPELRAGALLMCHEPRPGHVGQIAGHLHPAARLSINGRSTRRSCFAHDRGTLLLPAYGASTGNLNILGPAFAGLFKMQELAVYMLGKDRVYPVNPQRLTAR